MEASAVAAAPAVRPVVLCWKWEAFEGYRSKFTAEHVDVFARMVRRNYQKPVEVVCITDNSAGIHECDRVLELWDEFKDLRSPMDRQVGPQRNPSCYRRLRMFARDAGDWLGKRIVSMDLDCVITGDLAPILDRVEPFVMWGDTNPTTYYNGGLISFAAGARPQLYEQFRKDPAACIAKGKAKHQFGSDQAWIGACLGPREARYSTNDGVYSYRNHIRLREHGKLPANARVVFFHGQYDPWLGEPQTLPWVREHWR